MKTFFYIIAICLLPFIPKGQIKTLSDTSRIETSTKGSLPFKYIIDGNLIQDTSELMKLNPNDIEKIEILRNSNNKYDHGFEHSDYMLITTKHKDKKRKG